jgi:transposase
MIKMQDYVVRGKKVFVGLEDSKRAWRLCVRSEGMIVHELSLPGEAANLLKYLQSRYPQCQLSVIYEAGFHGFWLHDELVAAGYGCVVTPPHLVREAKVNKVKTDKGDARRLAQMLESGDYQSCHVPSRQRREDRQISRTLSDIQEDIVRMKNRVRRLLEFHGLDQGLKAGRWSQSDYEQVWLLLPSLSAPLRKSLEVYRQTLTSLESSREELLAELKRLKASSEYHQAVELKASCPGVGWLSAIRFTLEWGDLSRFESGKPLAHYLGLTPGEYSSGETKATGHITGQGSPQVRAWLIQCAWRAIRLDPVLAVKFRAVWHHSGSKKKAIVAVARKLALRLRAVELSGQPYEVGMIQ